MPCSRSAVNTGAACRRHTHRRPREIPKVEGNMEIRKKAVLYSCAIALAAGASLLAAEDNEDALLARAQQTFKPLPADAGTPQRPLTPDRVALGRALFFETRVSSDGK